VTKGDVLEAAQAKPLAVSEVKSTALKAPKVNLEPVGDRPEQRVPMSRLRARIAERLVQSQSTAAI
jgi:2-oxoglutarate dehydrogenase E2 component (dihydrolipoamide succinyltransferase)